MGLRQQMILLLILLLPCLSGCGSGGGGGTPTEKAVTVDYEGRLDQARITGGNSRQISSAAFKGTAGGYGLGGGFKAATASLPDSQARPMLLASVMDAIAPELSGDLSAAAVTDVYKAGVTRAGILSGDCTTTDGGFASYSVSVDTGTGIFSGGIAFNGYCSGGAVFNGSAGISGKGDFLTDPPVVEKVTYTPNLAALTVGLAPFTAAGSMTYVYGTTSVVINMWLNLKDGGTSKVLKMEDMKMLVTAGAGHTLYELVSGRVYHPDHGYVDCRTTGDFMVIDGQDWPSSGTLLCSGSSGSAVMLKALSSTLCAVEADTDGDGAVDYTGGAVGWEAL